MKRPTEQLLDELLEDAAPADFRAALMNKTLQQARDRQTVRRVRIGVGIAALIATLVTILWNGAASDQRQFATTHSLSSVETHPLNPSQIIQTHPSSDIFVIVSESAASAVSVVRTEPSVRTYVEISDQQLLVLLSGRAVSLVRHGPDDAELIFLDPKDQKELFLP
jgi:hypothetical protein